MDDDVGPLQRVPAGRRDQARVARAPRRRGGRCRSRPARPDGERRRGLAAERLRVVRRALAVGRSPTPPPSSGGGEGPQAQAVRRAGSHRAPTGRMHPPPSAGRNARSARRQRVRPTGRRGRRGGLAGGVARAALDGQEALARRRRRDLDRQRASSRPATARAAAGRRRPAPARRPRRGRACPAGCRRCPGSARRRGRAAPRGSGPRAAGCPVATRAPGGQAVEAARRADQHVARVLARRHRDDPEPRRAARRAGPWPSAPPGAPARPGAPPRAPSRTGPGRARASGPRRSSGRRWS